MVLLKKKHNIKQTNRMINLAKKKFTLFRPKIFSRHPSHSLLRVKLPLLPFKSVVRLGSMTPSFDRVECNTIQAVKNSSNKLLMKQCFTRNNVKTAEWYTATPTNFYIRDSFAGIDINVLPYPIICKSLYGSRGEGNTLIRSEQELKIWIKNKVLSNYIYERFYTYQVEFRIHCTSDGEFYSCRKMLKRDSDKSESWQRHDDNCVWILDTNILFDKPDNWNDIVNDCIKALNSLSLDIGCFDVKVQNNIDLRGRKRTNPDWIIIESCSAPSFGEITTQKYLQEIPKILKKKNG